MQIKLPDSDNNWVPNRPNGLQQDIETVYLELTSHAPAGFGSSCLEVISHLVMIGHSL